MLFPRPSLLVFISDDAPLLIHHTFSILLVHSTKNLSIKSNFDCLTLFSRADLHLLYLSLKIRNRLSVCLLYEEKIKEKEQVDKSLWPEIFMDILYRNAGFWLFQTLFCNVFLISGIFRIIKEKTKICYRES